MSNVAASIQGPRLDFIPDVMRAPLFTSIAYYLGAEAAFLIGTLSDNIFAPFWPPNAILFCSLLSARYDDWWKFVLAVLPAHILAELQVGMDWLPMAVAFLTNCAVALLNAWAVRWLLVRPPWLSSFRRALIFGVVAAGVGPALVSFFGAYVRIYGGGDIAEYWKFWTQWFMSNALGNLTLTPVILAFLSPNADRGPQSWSRTRWSEGLLVSFGVLCSCIIAINASLYWGGIGFLPALLYLPVPFVFLATVRFGIRGACLTVLALTLATIWVNLRSPTLFSASTAEANVLTLQLFLTGLAIPVLLLGAHVDSAQRMERRSRKLSQMVLRTQEENQRKIAGDLHEGVCQDLAAAYLRANCLFRLLPPDAKYEAKAVEEEILEAISTLRAAAYGMYPPLLAEGGLEPALRSFLRVYSERTGIVVSLQLPRDIGRLASETENVAFRIVEEALTNVERHSASATALVALSRTGPADELLLHIEDPAPSEPRIASVLSWLRRFAPTSITGGLGIAAMTERIHAIGGRLSIHSIGRSTVVEAVFPDAPMVLNNLDEVMALPAYCEPHTAPGPQ